jgi:hypothetical protein
MTDLSVLKRGGAIRLFWRKNQKVEREGYFIALTFDQ